MSASRYGHSRGGYWPETIGQVSVPIGSFAQACADSIQYRPSSAGRPWHSGAVEMSSVLPGTGRPGLERFFSYSGSFSGRKK